MTGKNNKDKTKIPYGIYCHDKNGMCPYWEKIGVIQWVSSPKDDFEFKCEFAENCKDECDGCKDIVVRCNFMDFTDFDESTLLFDKVKECGINDED